MRKLRTCLQFLLLFLSLPIVLVGQESSGSIHRQESEYYASHPELALPKILPKRMLPQDLQGTQVLNRIVYGFHPYWQNGSEANYPFSLLTHLVYFSGEVIDSTGAFSTTRSWSTATVVSDAMRYGVKVHFAVTLFGNHAKFLNNNTARAALIANIITEINRRSAHGCNIDFEAMSTAVADSFRTFIFQLGTALHAQGKELVVELPAVDWSTGAVMFGTTFFATVNPVVDYYFLMAYDYWWKNSSTAGPVAPLTTGTSIRHVTRSIDYYLGKGCGTGKLIAGYPYYGLDWQVKSSNRMADTLGGTGASSRTYTVVKTSYADTISASDQFFDATFNVPWYRYQTASGWRQCWYDDSTSLSMKYDSAIVRNLGGVGMWALGYDGAYPELWRLLKAKFAVPMTAGRIVFDDFEATVGHFDKTPTFSGSTAGISTGSVASYTNDMSRSGLGSLMVSLVDNASITTDWTVRLLSSSGTPANNVSVSVAGRIGFWLKTSSAPSTATIAIAVDDGTLKRSATTAVINDGTWHLYEWDLQGAGWTNFGTSVDTVVVGPTVTLDAIIFNAPNSSSTWTSFVDEVGFSPSTNVPNDGGEIPAGFSLEQNYPNPFNPQTVIRYQVSEIRDQGAVVSLRVYDLLGREVAVLVNEEQRPGRYQVSWNAATMSSGVYFYRLRAGEETISKKMILQK